MKNTIICYAANEWGYIVQVCLDGKIIYEYRAGNCTKESQTTVLPRSSDAEAPQTLARFAKQTALQTAREYKVVRENVIYDSDLHEDISHISPTY